MEVDRILADAFLAGHPAEAAREIECHPLPAIVAFLSDCSPDELARVVPAMDPALAAASLAAIDADHATGILAALPAAAASVVLRRVNADLRGPILERMQPAAAARIRMRLQYPADTAGALLDPAVLTAPPDLTVADALQRLGRADLRAHSYLFVVDADGVLAGVIGLGELLNAARDARVGAIARRELEVMHASAGRDAILTHPSWLDLQTPPVVDASGRLLGVMRYAMVRTLAAESSQGLGTSVAAAALEIGELAWEAGSDMAGELGAAFAAPAPAGKEPAGN
ncbi:MAG: CBS domain-containing protein [Acidobacteria bacterium]|nr:CBS domain-containing protein [Acidobacteriota bacterium]